jgi:hypothetical protein
VIENHSLSKRRIEIRTNSLGYRNPEIGEKRGLRVLFLGDSVAFGDFLPEEETFVRLVESKARAEGENWEVINAAVGAVSLENELAILKETGIGLEPDVVVLGFYLNDFLESPGVSCDHDHLAALAGGGQCLVRQVPGGPCPARRLETGVHRWKDTESWRLQGGQGRL